jgi:hypothetical protein
LRVRYIGFTGSAPSLSQEPEGILQMASALNRTIASKTPVQHDTSREIAAGSDDHRDIRLGGAFRLPMTKTPSDPGMIRLGGAFRLPLASRS